MEKRLPSLPNSPPTRSTSRPPSTRSHCSRLSGIGNQESVWAQVYSLQLDDFIGTIAERIDKLRAAMVGNASSGVLGCDREV